MPFGIRLLLLAAAGYTAVVGALTVLQRSLLYFPDGEPGSPAAVGVPEMRPVRLHTSDGLELLAWYAEAAPGHPTIVYLHGNGGNIAYRGPLVRPYLDDGFGVVLVSWRGYGGNPGKPTEAGLKEDGRAALRFLEAEGVPPQRTVLYGESLGTGVAVPLAAETEVAALVLDSPYTSAADVAVEQYWFAPARLLIWDRFESLAHMKDVHAPVLVVHGTGDRIIPVHHGRRMLDAANEPREGIFVAGAGHERLALGAADGILDFLRRHTVRPGTRRRRLPPPPAPRR